MGSHQPVTDPSLNPNSYSCSSLHMVIMGIVIEIIISIAIFTFGSERFEIEAQVRN